MLNAHLHAPPPKLTKAVPELPPALEPVLAKALSKSPLDRYPSCGEFVAAARGAVAERRVHRRRLALSVALLLLSALVGAGLALGIRSLAVDDDAPAVQPPPPAAAPPAPSKAELGQLLLQSEDGRTLNDVAYALIGAQEFERALPFAQKAVRKAEPGTLTRGFANFNLGYALLKLGRCEASLPPLRRALKLEPPALHRYIRPVITQAKRCARGKASAPGRSRSSDGRKPLSRAG